MNIEFIKAMDQIEKEKGVSKELLIDALESALVSAYRKNYGTQQNVKVNIDSETGNVEVFSHKVIVENVENNLLEMDIEDAKKVNNKYQVGDLIEVAIAPKNFGRIAAQTAKQVVVQRIREAEREIIYNL